MSPFGKILVSALAGPLFAVGAATQAMAVPVFTVNPNAIPGQSGFAPVQVSDVQFNSNALIQQIAPGVQLETGYATGTGLVNNGVDLIGSTDSIADLIGANYYLTFSATVHGITGFGPNQSGTIRPGDFTFTLHADVGNDNLYNVGDANTGAAPSVTGNTGNDVILGVGSSRFYGNAGFQSTGAPIFSATSDFVVCTGTSGQGNLGADLVMGGIAAGCGGFNAMNYFIDPDPFYDINFTSTTSGSASNLHHVDGKSYATLNGIVVDSNFGRVPEPSALLLFGSALLGLGMLVGYRRKLS